MRFLLDTNILSEMRKPKPHGGVLAWFTAHEPEGFAVPSLVLFELQVGIENVRKHDPLRAAAFEVWINRIESGSNIVLLDAAAAREAARLLNKHPPNLMADAMIAAMAKIRGLIVATRNTKDFDRFGTKSINPFLHR